MYKTTLNIQRAEVNDRPVLLVFVFIINVMLEVSCHVGCFIYSNSRQTISYKELIKMFCIVFYL